MVSTPASHARTSPRSSATKNSERFESTSTTIGTCDGSDYLGNTDIDDPTLKAADLFENTGPKGRRALNDLANGNRDAADVLLNMDPTTQRRFTRAYESDSVDSDELATALRRYDELDANEKRTADAMVARDGDDAVSLLDETVCNSPCKSFTKTWHDLKQTDAVTSNDATTFRNKLLDAKRRGTIGDDRAADMLGDAKKLANEDGIDATDVISRDDVFSRKVIQRYADSDSAGPDTLRKMDELGEVDLPDTQIDRKYKHADDFGVSGNKNPENKERFKEAIAEHAVDPDTEVIEGEYNRLEGDQSVTHIYNSRTGNNVIVNDGEFLTGFKLNSGQRTNIENDGVIGGS